MNDVTYWDGKDKQVLENAGHVHDSEGNCIKNRSGGRCHKPDTFVGQAAKTNKPDKIGPAAAAAAFFVFVFCLISLMIGGTFKVFTIWF